MALRRLEQRVQRLADAAAGVGEPLRDVGGDVLVGEALQAHGHRGSVQRAILVLEQLLHQAGL